MMDGVSTMDTGSNRPLLMMNVESIAEVKVLTSGYQAEFGPRERRAGHGGHQERHQPVPRIGLRRRAQLGLELEQQTEHPERQPEEHLEGARLGILDRRSGRQARRINKLFFFYAQEFAPRTRGNEVVQLPDADGGRAAGRLLADDRQQRQRRIPTFAIRASPAPAPRRIRRPAFADGGVLGKIPANMLYQTGLNILNLYPLPTIDNVPAGQAFNYTVTRPAESIYSWQPAVRLDYQASTALRASFKYSAWDQQAQTFLGTIPGFNDTRMQAAPVSSLTAIGQLPVDADDVPRGDVRAAARISSPGARRRSRAPARSSATTPAARRAFR